MPSITVNHAEIVCFCIESSNSEMFIGVPGHPISLLLAMGMQAAVSRQQHVDILALVTPCKRPRSNIMQESR